MQPWKEISYDKQSSKEDFKSFLNTSLLNKVKILKRKNLSVARALINSDLLWEIQYYYLENEQKGVGC